MAIRASGNKCPFCGGDDLRAFSAAASDAPGHDVSVVECRPCEVAWQWPLARDAEKSVAFFDAMYGQGEAGTYFDPLRRAAIAQLELSYIESLAPNRGDLLDIGCGAAEFVSAAAASGWRATGIDPALPTTLKAGPARLIRGSFEALGDERFDVVTLWDVIEHVDDPPSLLAAARGRVRSGGRVFVETGNYQSVGRINSAREWWGYQHDHRWYFSPPAIFGLLRDAGFSDPEVGRRVLRPGWNGKPEYDGPSALGHVRSAIRRPHKAAEILERYRALSRASHWPDWAGLEIVTISAKAA